MADRMLSHRYAAQEEDVAYLIEHGATLETACARVGIDPATYRDRLQQRQARG